MSSKNSIQIGLDFVLNNAQSSIKQIQSLLDSLNISKLDTQFGKNFSASMVKQLNTLSTESEKLKTSLQQSLNGKVDEKGLTNSINNITKVYSQLEVEINKIASLPSVDMERLIKIDPNLAKEITNIEQKIQHLQKTISEESKSGLAKALEEVNAATAGFVKGSSPDKHVKELNNALNSSKIDIEEYAAALKGLQAKYADYIESSKKAAQNAGQDWDKSGNITRNAQAFETLRQAVESAVPAIKEVKTQTSGLESERISKMSQAYTEVATKAQETAKGVKEASSGMQDYGRTMTSAARAQNEFIGELDQVKSRVKYFFSLTNSIQLFKNAIRDAYETVKELDAAMTETAVVTDFSVSDMWDALPQYTKLAESLGATTLGAYETMTLYYQQGLKTNEAMQLGTETMKMARIAGMDYATATNLMTSALRGFNLELNTTSAQRVNDVYSELAAITASDTEGIATAMSKTASIANSANMELETTSAFLSQIIETTQEAPETAGTALKTIIARFSEVKKLYSQGQFTGTDGEGEAIEVNKVAKALKTAGINMNKFFSGQVGLDDIFLELAEKWDTLDITQQRYIATQAAGSRQQSRFIAMMSNYDRTMELVNAAYNSNGASAEQFAKTQDSLQSKLNKLSDEWERFTMGLANSTVIKGAVDLLTNLLSTINNLTEAFDGGKGITSGILKFTAALGTIKLGKTLLSGGLTGVIGNLSNSFNKMDTSGIGKAGDNAGKTFGTSFVTSLNEKVNSNSIFGKSANMMSGVNDWYAQQLDKINLSKAFKDNAKKNNGFMGISDFSSLMEDSISSKATLSGKFGQKFSAALQKELSPQILNSFKEMGAVIPEQGMNDLFSGFNNALSSGEFSGGLDSLKQEVYNKFFSFSKIEDKTSDDDAAKFAKEKTDALFSNMDVELGEVNKAIPKTVQNFKTVQDGLSGISAIGTGTAVALGLISNKLREAGNDKAADALDKVSSGLMMISVAAGVASTAMSVFASGALTALIPLLPIIIAVGAAIALVAVTVKAIEASSVSELSKEIDRLTESTENAQKAAESLQESYDNFSSAREKYQSLREELENLTKGTQAYQEKLLEVNKAASELTGEYDVKYKVTSDGLIVVDEQDLQAKMQDSLEKSTQALNVQRGLEERLSKAQTFQNFLTSDEENDKNTIKIIKDTLKSSNIEIADDQIKFPSWLESIATAIGDLGSGGTYSAMKSFAQDNRVAVSTADFSKYLKEAVYQGALTSNGVENKEAIEAILQADGITNQSQIDALITAIENGGESLYNEIEKIYDKIPSETDSVNQIKSILSTNKDIVDSGEIDAVAQYLGKYTTSKSITGEASKQVSAMINKEDIYKEYAKRVGYTYNNGKMFDQNNQEITNLEDQLDSMKDYLKEAFSQDAYLKQGETLAKLFEKIDRTNSSSGVSNLMGALTEGSTRIDKLFLKKISDAISTEDMQKALHLSKTDYSDLATNLGMTSSQQLTSYFQQMADNIAQAQTKQLTALRAAYMGTFSINGEDNKTAGIISESFEQKMAALSNAQITFLSETTASLQKNFGTTQAQDFLKKAIGENYDKLNSQQAQSDYINSISASLGGIDFSDAIGSATELHQAELRAKNTLVEMGKDVDNISFDNLTTAAEKGAYTVYNLSKNLQEQIGSVSQFKQLYNSDEWTNIEKRAAKLRKNGVLSSDDITTLASEFDTLRQVMNNTGMGAKGIADIINGLTDGTLSGINDIDEGLWQLIDDTNALSSTIDKALSFVKNFDPGIDEGEVDDWLKSTKEKVNELFDNGEYGNTQLYNYLDAMFSDFSKNVIKDGLKKAEEKALKKLNTGNADNFSGIWRDIATDTTGNYNAKMKARGWTVTPEANGGTGIEFTGAEGMKGTTKELRQALMESYGATEDMANMLITSFKNSSATFRQTMEWNDFKGGIDKYVAQQKTQNGNYVFSTKNVEKTAAMTGKSTLEIYKQIAKQQGISQKTIDSFKSADEAIEALNNQTGNYVISLTKAGGIIKTVTELQDDLNKAYGGEKGKSGKVWDNGASNWLTTFSKDGKTIDIADVKSALAKAGFSESDQTDLIQEGLKQLQKGNTKKWTYKGVELDYTELKNDTATALQNALDQLDNTNLVNNIKNGFVEGWLEAQELMEFKAKNDWTSGETIQYYQAGLSSREHGAEEYNSVKNVLSQAGGNIENATISIDGDTIEAYDKVAKIKVLLNELDNGTYSVNIVDQGVSKTEKQLEELNTQVYTIDGKKVKFYVDSNTNTVYDEAGNLYGILNAIGEPVKVEISDNGTTAKLTDQGQDYYFTLDKVSGQWKVDLKNNAPEQQTKAESYARSLNSIPESKTTTVTTVYREVRVTSTGDAASAGLNRRTATGKYGEVKKPTANARWVYVGGGTTYGYWAYAQGTTRAGVPRNEKALVGEEGPELVETNDGKAHLVGMHGPEIAKLKKGDIVHNASDTDRILKGKSTKKMRAYKAGTFSAYKDTGYTGQKPKNNNSSGSNSGSKGSSSSSGESAYQKAKSYYDNQLQNEVISLDWYINRLNNMRKTISMTKEEQQELNKAILDARYDKISSQAERSTISLKDQHAALVKLYKSYSSGNTEGALKLIQEQRDLSKTIIDTQREVGEASPEWYLQTIKQQQKWYKKGSSKWYDYQKEILSTEQENLENRFNNGEISMWWYIEGLKKLQKQYAATSAQARELSKQIRDQNTAYAEAAQQHGLWSMDWMITKLKENLAQMKEDTEEYRELLDKIRDYEMQNASNKYERGQWTYEQTMAFYKQYEAENNFAKSTEQYQELKQKQTELEINHINELLDKYSQLNDQLGNIDTGEERAKEIININNELAETHDRLVDIKYALENQELTEAQRKAFQEEYNELLVRQINLIDEAQDKQKEYTDIMKDGLEAQKKLLTDGWGTDDPKKAARLGLMSVQYAENDRYLAQQKKETAKNNMYAALVEPQQAMIQKYLAEVAQKRANGEYSDDLQYAMALSEATAKGMANAPTSALPYARIDETSGMVTIDQAALNNLKVSDPEEYRKVMEIITLMQGYSEDWMEGNITETEAVELLDELTSNQDYIDLINRTANALKEIDQNELEELQDQQDSIKEIADSVASIVEKVREAVDKIREQRDNEENRQNLIDKQTRLAYLRQDSTGNALEIKQLEKELSEESQSYTDTLIDQKINELEEQNEETQDQLQELIELKQQEIKQKEKDGTYYQQAQKIVDDFISEDLDSVSNNTKDIRDTYLGQILKEGEKIDTSMSKPEQENTWNEIKKEGEAAGTSKELHDTAKNAGLTQETAKDTAKSFAETSKDIAQVTGQIATSFVPALDYAISSITDAVKKDKENKKYTNDSLAGKPETKPNGVDSAPKPAEKPSTPAQPAKPAKPAQPAKPSQPAKPKPTTTQGDGKPRVGDNVTFVSGQYYNSSDGEAPVGYWYRGQKNKVYITKINTASWATHPYHISSTKTFGKGDLGWVKLNQLQGYKTGGMVDFTGPAWLDGTKSKPESVLSARDTQNLLALTDVLSNLRNNTTTSNNSSNISNEINIEVKVDKIDNDLDVNKLADTIGEKVKRSIYKDTKGFSNTRLTHR